MDERTLTGPLTVAPVLQGEGRTLLIPGSDGILYRKRLEMDEVEALRRTLALSTEELEAEASRQRAAQRLTIPNGANLANGAGMPSQN